MTQHKISVHCTIRDFKFNKHCMKKISNFLKFYDIAENVFSFLIVIIFTTRSAINGYNCRWNIQNSKMHCVMFILL